MNQVDQLIEDEWSIYIERRRIYTSSYDMYKLFNLKCAKTHEKNHRLNIIK